MMEPEWLEHPEQMGSDAVMRLPELIAQYPYCATYKLLYTVALANVHSTKLEQEVRHTAVALPDRQRLFTLVNKGEYDWVTLMQELEKRRRGTGQEANDFELIDRFLESLNTPTHEAPAYDLETMAAGMADYPLDDEPETGQEADTATSDDEDQLALIDNFLLAEQQGTLFVPKVEPRKSEEDTTGELEKIKERALLTESLAKVYVKKHKFEQALAIFLDLNLKYPKKNSYFADQIRYLEKVIAYQKEEKADSEAPAEA